MHYEFLIKITYQKLKTERINKNVAKKNVPNINFVGKKKVFLIISAIAVILSLAMTFTGVEVAIEFKGGTIISYEYKDVEGKTLTIEDIEKTLDPIIADSYRVQIGDSFNDDAKTVSISYAGKVTRTSSDGAVDNTNLNSNAFGTDTSAEETDGTETADGTDGTETTDGTSDTEQTTSDGAGTTNNVNNPNNANIQKQIEITNALTEAFPDNSFALLDSSNVDATAGKTFFLKCLTAVAFAALILILYIGLRFKAISGWFAGVCAIIALLHDVIISYGVFVLLGFEIDSNFMAVVLTILGYSINDTIVIYDRIRENRKLHKKMGKEELVNLSVNQSLSRSIKTSVTTVGSMIIVSVVCAVMGITSILSLSVPLAIGMAVGTYSSICVAPSIWLLKKDQPKK
jgi:preprotein translocase subunit SecF